MEKGGVLSLLGSTPYTHVIYPASLHQSGKGGYTAVSPLRGRLAKEGKFPMA